MRMTRLTDTSKKETVPSSGISFVEFALGAAIVVAHNVFHVVPNEVPILFLLALVSIRLREGSWRAIGLGRPKSWPLTIVFALAATAAVIAMQVLVDPAMVTALGLHHAKSAQTSLGLKRDDVWSLLKWLVVSWTFAAFGEEIVYRRYLLSRAAEVGGGSTLGYWLALPVVSALFGIGHYYQGSAGIYETACDGFIIGLAYLLAGRNLWVAVLAHGFFDTAAAIASLLGVAD